MDEYLEKLFADAYRQENEQEETVVRSLPFIAAAAAIIVAVVREIGREAPPWGWRLEALSVHALLIFSGLALVYAGWFVFQALRRRPFRYPRNESEIRATAIQLIDYHVQTGLAPEEAEVAALADLRSEMIKQYAVCAENNQRHNEARQAARTQAFHGLMAAFLFVVLLVATTYMQSAFRGVLADGEADFPDIEARSKDPVGGGDAASRATEDGVGAGDKAAPGSAADGDQGIMGESADEGD